MQFQPNGIRNDLNSEYLSFRSKNKAPLLNLLDMIHETIHIIS